MILNISGRTDIVAFYTPWFLNRYKEGYVDVRNPFYKKQVSRIYFDDVDLIVFCTKNPIPIVDHLKTINKPILFHITLTPYHKDLEPNVPPKGLIIENIKKISEQIGKENVYIRYDPIIINKKYSIDYHIKSFDNLCKKLDGYITNIIVSFVDIYKNVEKNKEILDIYNFTDEMYEQIGTNFSRIAKEHNMTVQTCSEQNRLLEYGFINKDCVDFNTAYRLTHKTNFKKWKSRNNPFCACAEMVDIGVYNTCSHFCKYCYANFDENKVENNKKKHNPNSSLLIGELEPDDIIKIRKQ